jgi:hypothetical protein
MAGNFYGFTAGNISTDEYVKRLMALGQPNWFKKQQAEAYNRTVDDWNNRKIYSLDLRAGAYVHHQRKQIDLSIFDEPDTVAGQTIHQTEYLQTPKNPGIRKLRVSTHGATIPVSIGRRAVTGHIVDSGPIQPHLVGAHSYVVRERVPIYDGVS